MAAANRSAHPNLPGVPWWGAVLIAVIATTIGFAFDAGSGNKDLGNVFGALYAVGCVAAVLAVRQSSIFTAVIQPPLILFVAVPSAYFVFHGAEFTGIKDTLINFGYPLIERFPLMLFTSAGVLLIGLVRWYFAMSSRSTVAAAPTADRRAMLPLACSPGWRPSSPRSCAALTSTTRAAPKKHPGASTASIAPRPWRSGPARVGPPSVPRPPDPGTPVPRWRTSPRRRSVPAAIDPAPPGPRRRSRAPNFAEAPRRRRQPRDPSGRTPPSSRREPREPRSANAATPTARRRSAAAGSSRTRPTRPTSRIRPTNHRRGNDRRAGPTETAATITRCRGCGIAARVRTIRVSSPGRAAQVSGTPSPGAPTADARRTLGAGGTDLARKCEHQRLVGGGHRLHGAVAVLGQPVQHAADQDLGH